MTFHIPPLSSGGIVLSYQCTSSCRHCLYAASPSWKEWMTQEDIDTVYRTLKKHSRFLTGIHLAGGEPFLNPGLLEYAVRRAGDLDIPLDYVETNAFWGTSDEKTESILTAFKNAGLNRILVSCTPFHAEFVPLERTRRVIESGRRILGRGNVLVYTDFFYRQLRDLHPDRPMILEDYIALLGEEQAALVLAGECGLIPNGRAATELAFLYVRRAPSAYFGETCRRELGNPHHVHIDLYGNYIAGLCAGISLGNGYNLDRLYGETDFTGRPVLGCLAEGGVEALFHWARTNYGFEENPEGYIAKCHLCLDIRRFLVQKQKFSELQPAAFYSNV